jgi:hypothetical protein
MHRTSALVVTLTMAAVSAADEGQKRDFSEGQQFFEAQVVPRLAENGCPMCHSVGYVQPNVVVYAELMPYLAMGDAPEKTPVIRKIANLRAIRPDLPTHPGGPRCETIKSEPCRTIIEWWGIEFGQASPSNGDGK